MLKTHFREEENNYNIYVPITLETNIINSFVNSFKHISNPKIVPLKTLLPHADIHIKCQYSLI